MVDTSYLTSLREFHNSSGDNRQRVKVGDVVLVHNEGPRINWRLAVIKDLITGGDNLVDSCYSYEYKRNKSSYHETLPIGSEPG